jgi:hypothetical protein
MTLFPPHLGKLTKGVLISMGWRTAIISCCVRSKESAESADVSAAETSQATLPGVTMSLSKIALVLLLVLSGACGAGDAVQCNTDQDCQLAGVLPDSSLVSMDKANVRDGHYPFWGYLHFYTANLQGASSPAASAFVTRFAVPQLDRDLLDAIIDSSLIPVCAMKVARDSDSGPLQRPPYDSRCGCYFENRTMARSSCSPCMTPEQCPATAPSCNYGFCEVLL